MCFPSHSEISILALVAGSIPAVVSTVGPGRACQVERVLVPRRFAGAAGKPQVYALVQIFSRSAIFSSRGCLSVVAAHLQHVLLAAVAPQEKIVAGVTLNL